MSNTSERVAGEIRAEMARQKISQSALAEQVGMKRITLSDRLHGKRPFDVDQLYRISDALGVSMLDLIPEEAA